MQRGRQMMVLETGAPLRRQLRTRPLCCHWPNWKAECVERRTLRLERGKDCKALPIATHPTRIIHSTRWPTKGGENRYTHADRKRIANM